MKQTILKADVIIIGGGGAGLSAALTAAEHGASVIVLEKRNIVGGNTALASGGTFAADSPVQRRLSLTATKDECFNILMDWTHWKVNPRIARAYINKSGDTIRWLEEKGIVYDIHPFYPGQSPVITHGPRGRGAEVIRTLYQNCLDKDVQIIVRTEVTNILKGKNGEVRGVLARTRHKEIEIHGKAVLIATGGYGGNLDLIKKYCGYYQETIKCIGVPNMGDGLRMATEMGAATEGLGMLQMDGPCTPRPVRIQINVSDSSIIPLRLTSILLQPSTMWVNKNGIRFVDEKEGYSPFRVSNPVARQPDAICFSLLDSNLVKNMEEHGLFLRGGEFGKKVPGLQSALKQQAKEGTWSIEQADRDICNGCGVCENSCPLDIIRLDTIVSDKNEYSPCRATCPAGIDMRSYNYLLRQGKIQDALEIIRQSNPFPAITGRVCPHPCESECARKEVDEAVNINALERFIADHAESGKIKAVKIKSTFRTAIIGSGPAGLSCAYYLTIMGYPVTVFEQMPILGGMLRFGIPEYRLPKKIVEEQVDYLRNLGVEFKTGIALGKDITLDQLQKDYHSVFIATGNQLSIKMDLKGSDNNGIFWGLDFLRDINLGKKIELKGNVVIIGGGNVAIDVALTALRLGAGYVELACLETGEQIPAYKDEIKQAIDEGVIINEGWGPHQILSKNNKITGIELVSCTSVFDSKGRFSPKYDLTATKIVKADTVILAIGQAPDLSPLPEELAISKTGTIKVDPITLETSIPGVFSGGEIAMGGGSVIKAFASGHNAAISIDRYFKKENLSRGSDIPHKTVEKPPKDGIKKATREQALLITGEKLKGNFKEVKCGFDEDSTYYEVERCMSCGSRPIVEYVDECRLCLSCERNCPVKAISIKPVKSIPPLVKVADTWDEVAEWIGTDADTLKTTIDEYNTSCDKGHDALFCKDRMFLTPLRTPPYYAIKCHLDFLDTIGGIKINEHMEVLNTKDKPIPGLFAAGIDTGGWEDNTYCSRLTGTTFSFALNSGRIAGENAVNYISK